MAKRTKGTKRPVTTRAVLQRINRKLKSEMEQLCAARGERMQQELGRYHVINFRMNAVAHKHVDPEELARKLGVLRPYEAMVDAE